MRKSIFTSSLLLLVAIAASACGSSGVSSDEEARRAYLGLEQSIPKAVNLGFDGYNMATSANIAPQSAAGDSAGMMTISGQVDQGASNNKTMRLYIAMVGYTDGTLHVDTSNGTVDVNLTYDTSTTVTSQPYLELKLSNVPTGAGTGNLMGSLTGTYDLHGDIEGSVDLALTLTGQIMSDGTGALAPVAGSTTVTGTATDGNGTYDVSLMF
jgi:hypothetical protein